MLSLAASQKMLGLDLGTTGLRAVEVSWRDGAPVLERWAAVDFPAPVPSWLDVDQGEMGERVRNSLAGRGFSARYTAHGICGESVAQQYFNFPQLLASDVGDAVRLEVESGLPFRVDSALMDYVLFKELRLESGKVRTHGLAIAADGPFIESRLGVLRKAKLEPTSVEPDSMACVNAMLATRDLSAVEGAIAIFNVGHRYSNVALVSRDGTVLIRDVPFGGRHLTESISKALQLGLDGAAHIKANLWTENAALDKAQEQKLAEAVQQNLSELTSRLRETVSYWVGERLTPGLAKVFITGGGSQVRGMDEAIADAFAVPVERWTPFAGGAPNDEARLWENRLTVAFGLALRKFGKSKNGTR